MQAVTLSQADANTSRKPTSPASAGYNFRVASMCNEFHSSLAGLMQGVSSFRILGSASWLVTPEPGPHDVLMHAASRAHP
jgi:hypothetical protein